MPTIAYQNGTLTFDCATEGAEIVSEITDEDIKKYSTKSINLSATYQISAYAKQDGYNKSDVAYATLTFNLENSGTNEDGIISVAAHPVLITTEGSTIRVKGLVNTKEVRYATTDGKLLGASRVIDGESLFDTRMPAGTIVIVSTDGGSAKTMLR